MKEDRLQDKNFEQRLREEAGHFEMQPSEAVWKKIESALQAHRPSKKIFIWKWAAVAAVVLLIGGLGWYFLGSSYRQSAIKNLPAVVSNNEQPDTGNTLHQKKNQTAKITTSEKHKENSSASVPVKTINATPSNGLAANRQHRVQPANEQAAIAQNTASESGIFLQKNNAKDHRLSVLQKTAEIFVKDGLDIHAATLQYSDRIARLMLEEAAPATPLLAHNDADENKISVDLFFTPGVSYRTLKTGSGSAPQSFDAPNSSNANSLLRPNNTQDFNTLERVNIQDKPLQQQQSWGWNSGVRVALHLSPKWIVQTGISLRQTDYEITAYKQDPAYVSGNGYATTSNGPVSNSLYARYAGRNPETSRATTLENSYLSTELPLLVGRKFGNPDKFSLTVLTGVGLTYLLHSNAVMYAPVSQRYFSDNDYLHPFNSSLILEASMNIPLSKQVGFSIGPAFQYQMFSSYKNYNSVKEYPYLIGIKTALSLR